MVVPSSTTTRPPHFAHSGIYYRDKFGVATNDVEFFATVKQAYVEALQWIVLYYYRGVSASRARRRLAQTPAFRMCPSRFAGD